MKYTLQRLTDPVIEPVTLAEMKTHLRMFEDITAEDDLVTSLIVAAREWVEDYTGRCMVEQTWRMTIGDYVPPDVSGLVVGELPPASQGIVLRPSPVIAITAVATVDSDNVETAVAASDYQLRDGGSKWPRLVGLESATEMRITYRAGFADTTGSPTQGVEMIPDVLKLATRLVCANYYEQRAPVVTGTITAELPLTVKWLLKSQMCNLQFA